MRGANQLRGFPLAPRVDGSLVDRGHVIPHLSGGEFGPNIFRQDRALNRGWSEQGKRYRALEREAAATPGSLYFGHLIYTDESADPSLIETGVVRGASLHVQSFDNRPLAPKVASRAGRRGSSCAEAAAVPGGHLAGLPAHCTRE